MTLTSASIALRAAARLLATETPRKNDQRETKTGQYAHRLDRLCECGHKRGSHVSGGGECIAHEVEDVEEMCPCRKFKAARR